MILQPILSSNLSSAGELFIYIAPKYTYLKEPCFLTCNHLTLSDMHKLDLHNDSLYISEIFQEYKLWNKCPVNVCICCLAGSVPVCTFLSLEKI